MVPAPHLLFLVLLAVLVLVAVDHLWAARVYRRTLRRRIEARSDQLKRDARRRMAERPTLNTRSDAP